MKRITIKSTLWGALAGIGMVLSTNAGATAAGWTFSCSGAACDTTPTSSNVAFGNTRTYLDNTSGNQLSLSASAISNTGGTNTSGTSATNTKIQDAYLAIYSGGLGVGNRDLATGKDGDTVNDTDSGETTSPEHAIDNNSRYDMALFSFGSTDVTLKTVSFGYVSGDADFVVLAYDPSGAQPADPRSTLVGTTGINGSSTYSGLLTQGWTLVGNYSNSSTGQLNINAGLASSSYWLIGAYNSTWSSTSCKKQSGSTTTCDTGNDYFKISALTGEYTPPPPPPPPPGGGSSVPEPGTMALIAAAVLGLGLRHRRRSN